MLCHRASASASACCQSWSATAGAFLLQHHHRRQLPSRHMVASAGGASWRRRQRLHYPPAPDSHSESGSSSSFISISSSSHGRLHAQAYSHLMLPPPSPSTEAVGRPSAGPAHLTGFGSRGSRAGTCAGADPSSLAQDLHPFHTDAPFSSAAAAVPPAPTQAFRGVRVQRSAARRLRHLAPVPVPITGRSSPSLHSLASSQLPLSTSHPSPACLTSSTQFHTGIAIRTRAQAQAQAQVESHLVEPATLSKTPGEPAAEAAAAAVAAPIQVRMQEWLECRGEGEACGALYVADTPEGRGLHAREPIAKGNCMLQMPRGLIISPQSLAQEVAEMVPAGASEWARVALFLLAELHAGEASCWRTYVDVLPAHGSLHSTIFWRPAELALLHASLQEATRARQVLIAEEYAAVAPAIEQCPHVFGACLDENEFEHMYAVVCSRAWNIEAVGNLALVPFVDFFNHDPASQALLYYDEDAECAEVNADRDHAAGSQVLISYGELTNSVLALDFGFTLAHNPHETVSLWVPLLMEGVPGGSTADGSTARGSAAGGAAAGGSTTGGSTAGGGMTGGSSAAAELVAAKLSLLAEHKLVAGPHANGAQFEVRAAGSPAGRGKGVPHAMRAFARIGSAQSLEEVAELAEEAARLDGRVARRPLRGGDREARAMTVLLLAVESHMERQAAALLSVAEAEVNGAVHPERASMARQLWHGRLEVLRSVAAWLRPRAVGGGFDVLLAN